MKKIIEFIKYDIGFSGLVFIVSIILICSIIALPFFANNDKSITINLSECLATTGGTRSGVEQISSIQSGNTQIPVFSSYSEVEITYQCQTTRWVRK